MKKVLKIVTILLIVLMMQLNMNYVFAEGGKTTKTETTTTKKNTTKKTTPNKPEGLVDVEEEGKSDEPWSHYLRWLYRSI